MERQKSASTNVGYEQTVEIESFLKIVLRRFKKNRLAMLGAFVVVFLYLVAVFAPFIATHDPNATNTIMRLKPPSRDNYFGTDRLGRDIFSRVVYGSRISLSVGLVAVGIAVTIGTLIGSVSGYYGGTVDNVLMRFTDIMMSIPTLFLVITIVAMFGGNIWYTMLAIGLTGWTGVARLVRGSFLSLKEQEFAEACRAIGASDFRIMFRHLLPNAMAPIIVAATLGVASAILTETSLSYLGLGVQPPTPTWGNILREGYQYIKYAWWYGTFPGVAIFITMMAFNMLGDGLRDALDPRLKE